MGNNVFFEKSAFLNNMRDSFIVEKTGKEVKEKVLTLIEKANAKVESLRLKKEIIRTKIGEDPMKKYTDYYYIPFPNDSIDAPLVYDTCSTVSSEVDSMGPISPQQPSDEVLKLKHEYNDLTRECVDTRYDLLSMNTIIDSCSDTKVYTFSLTQATSLGF